METWSTRTLSSMRSSLKDVSQFQGCVDITSSVATRNSTMKYTVGNDTECTTSIYNELNETVTTKCTEAATLTSEGWYLFRSGRTTRLAWFDRGVCWRYYIIVPSPACTRPLTCHDNTPQHHARVGALAAHHPVWMSRHTRGSRQDIHSTRVPLRRKAVDGSSRTLTGHKEFRRLVWTSTW